MLKKAIILISKLYSSSDIKENLLSGPALHTIFGPNSPATEKKMKTNEYFYLSSKILHCSLIMAGGKGKRIEMTNFWRTKDIPSCVLSHLLDHEDD